ncbi:hypothetical protein GMA12_16750 [Kocuria sediminis]|uniref:Uncharacterized protein n=1 Tax=Kocuria sediminis TaxID=1038857 RepID=A0A6N8GPR7_9MICC|nr:hypothetical protein [Kocuria sediminis]MUN64769.1 hypothetical protein [Kocuria sediminis]
MTPSAAGALAVELRPHSPLHWIATYYPMVDTPAGRWADVTWELHQRLIPTSEAAPQAARWLDLRSPDPGHPGYTAHRAWAVELAAGYTAALAVYEAEAIEAPSTPQAVQHLRAGTVVIPAGQLSEWLLDDLQNETSDVRG